MLSRCRLGIRVDSGFGIPYATCWMRLSVKPEVILSAGKKTILGSLNKSKLVEWAYAMQIAAPTTLSKGELIDALAKKRSLSVEDLLQELSRDQLKKICRDVGLGDSGRAKQVIIDRLLGGPELARPTQSTAQVPHKPMPPALLSPGPATGHDGHRLDRDVQVADITRLTSVDALAAFLHELGYPTDARTTLEAEGVGLGSGGPTIRQLELLSEDEDGFLQVIFVQLHSVTAKARGNLVRAFGRGTVADRLLILTSDFDTLEFVLIEKDTGTTRSKGMSPTTKLRFRVFVVPRRWPQQMLRIVRRLTYTMDDGLRQYDKLRGVFDAAHFSGTYFINRALFSDHYLETRLREDPAWSSSSPGPAFESARRYVDGRDRVRGEPLDTMCREFYDPIWSVLGFRPRRLDRKADHLSADYELYDGRDERRTVALAYPWGRWLDGPDPNDPDRPTENPGATVVTLLERGDADWVVVTNGQLWRLYSKNAHSRSTNFYEVDLPDVLIASGLSDPNEAFRYWWLFFRLEAFLPTDDARESCWLDTVVQGSRDYAREVEDELKRRVFYDVVPALSHGFLHDRRTRLGNRATPDESELERIRAGTLTLLYRLLFLLYAESRDLLPIREAEYYKLSLKSLKEEVAEKAGVAESEADDKINGTFRKSSTVLYDRLADPENGLFAAMGDGRPAANVPRYNGGLFRLDPAEASDEHEAEIVEFLNTHKVPDAFLALAIDRLARVEDSRTYELAFVDYKSLGVRQLGSIYEGLLEFKLRIADEDLAVTDRKKLGDWIPLAKTRAGKRNRTIREIKKNSLYLVRDKSERKASGSYYTPDHIVEYIVEHTVGPVLERKTEALRDEFRKAERAYHVTLDNARTDPRIMLAWRPEWGAPREGTSGSPTESDLRRFALEHTFKAHDQLVEKLFDIKVLDPAMGSGHFLVEAVDYITDGLLHFLNAFPVNPISVSLERTREAILESLREQGIETDEILRRQLTDIHLLKRHVLKRCIYGVDLNPLATELAKVSLWLDAFTLGAPLSFLDHHLRTGNSLIGSSIEDLEKAVEGQIFRIDATHLLRAVQSVLLVARLTDSTAGEVAESKKAYDIARRTLDGYRILLDILVAKHFGLGQAGAALIEMAPQLDFTSIDAFRASFVKEVTSKKLPDTELTKFAKAHGIHKTHGVGEDTLDAVEDLVKERRFFHWDLEFPEVFYEFTGIGEGRIKRRSKDDAGFDAVVGNPPYDVLEKERLEDQHRHSGLASYARASGHFDPGLGGKLNLFRLFVVQSLRLLAADRRYGQIIPLAVVGDISCSRLRRHLFGHTAFLAVHCFPQKDDDHCRIFTDAKLSTTILFAGSLTVGGGVGRDVRISVYPRHLLTDMPLSACIRRTDLRLLDPQNQPIPLVDQDMWDVCAKICRNAKMQPLGQQDGLIVSRGEINQTTYREYITQNPRHARLLKGSEIGRYHLRDTPSQGEREWFDHKKFVASGKSRPVSARRRIAIQRITGVDEQVRVVAAIVDPPCYFADSTNSIEVFDGAPLCAEYLLALLNSTLFQWRFRLTSTNNNVGTNELRAMPIPMIDLTDTDDDAPHSRLVALVNNVQERARCRAAGRTGRQSHRWTDDDDLVALDQEIDDIVFQLFDLTLDERSLIKQWDHRGALANREVSAPNRHGRYATSHE